MNFLRIERQKWVDLGILKIIDDGVFICKFKVASSDKTRKTHMPFFMIVNFHKNEWLIVVVL